MEKFLIKSELRRLWSIIKSLDKKIVIIFISVAVLQTISYYYTSRAFFRHYLFQYFQSDSNVFLIEYYYWFIGNRILLLVYRGLFYLLYSSPVNYKILNEGKDFWIRNFFRGL